MPLGDEPEFTFNCNVFIEQEFCVSLVQCLVFATKQINFFATEIKKIGG